MFESEWWEMDGNVPMTVLHVLGVHDKIKLQQLSHDCIVGSLARVLVLLVQDLLYRVNWSVQCQVIPHACEHI